MNIGLTVGVEVGIALSKALGNGDGGPVFFDDFWRERQEEDGISPFFASKEKAFQGPAAAAATTTEK